MKASEIKINEEYTVIVLERNGVKDYYLEKKDYGDLMYMFGTEQDIEITEELVMDYVEDAEEFFI